MKILHTSDLHIGKKLNGRSRLDEQKDVLNELCDIADGRSVDLVIIAGDVFDTSVPSAEAEETFFSFIKKISSPERAVVIISGNHDDWQRLCACRDLAAKSNVYVFGGSFAPPSGNASNCVYAEQTGVNYCIVKKGDERLYLGLLPYQSEQRLGEKKSEQPYEERMSEKIGECFAGNVNGLPQIFVGHLFMLGGSGTDGERQIELGGTRIISKTAIPEECLYSALGHLHKRQIIDEKRRILYSGSILGYSFDEAGIEKSVTFFEISGGKLTNMQTVAFTKGKKLVNLKATELAAGEELLKKYEDCLAKLTLKLDHALSEKESKELLTEYPSLCELDLVAFSGERREKCNDRRKLSDEEAFTEYYKSRFDTEPPKELLQLYLGFMTEGGVE